MTVSWEVRRLYSHRYYQGNQFCFCSGTDLFSVDGLDSLDFRLRHDESFPIAIYIRRTFFIIITVHLCSIGRVD